jgi:ankyrin repeat protein
MSAAAVERPVSPSV